MTHTKRVKNMFSQKLINILETFWPFFKQIFGT